jgi:hypothetical protein
VVCGHKFEFVKVVSGGSTRKLPPHPWTMYQKLLELPVGAFQASEILVGPVAVI